MRIDLAERSPTDHDQTAFDREALRADALIQMRGTLKLREAGDISLQQSEQRTTTMEQWRLTMELPRPGRDRQQTDRED